MTNATGLGVKFIRASCERLFVANVVHREACSRRIISQVLAEHPRGRNLDQRVIGFIPDDIPIIFLLKRIGDSGWDCVEKSRFALNYEWVAAIFQRKSDMRILCDIPRLDRIASGTDKCFFIEPYEPDRHEMRRAVRTDSGKPDIGGSF